MVKNLKLQKKTAIFLILCKKLVYYGYFLAPQLPFFFTVQVSFVPFIYYALEEHEL